VSAEFPVYARSGISLAHGEGYRVWDTDGKEYLDFYGGHAVALLGYNNPALVEAVQKQASELIFTSNAVENPARTQASLDIVSVAPAGFDRVFLVNSGAEANENALKMAFWKTGRSKAVSLKGSFHGRTAAAATVTDGSTGWYGFPRTPFDVEFVQPEDFDALEAALTEDVAAFIYEAVQGLGGAVVLSDAFLQRARELCTERGIVMIADEVQCGTGRSGQWWATPVRPDLMTTAKGLAGGFPVSVVLAPAEWADSLAIGKLGTTFGAGPMACAMISATIKQVTPELLANVRRLAERIQNEAPVEKVSGKGFLLGLNCDRPAKEILPLLRKRGILAGDAKKPNMVRLLPPLIIDDAAVDQLISTLKDVL